MTKEGGKASRKHRGKQRKMKKRNKIQNRRKKIRDNN